MRKFLFGILFSAAVTCQAQLSSTFTTVVTRGTVTNAVGGLDFNWATNKVTVPKGSVGRVATRLGGSGEIYFEKEGIRWGCDVGHVIEGPIEFHCIAYGGTSLVTVEQWRNGSSLKAAVKIIP